MLAQGFAGFALWMRRPDIPRHCIVAKLRHFLSYYYVLSYACSTYVPILTFHASRIANSGRDSLVLQTRLLHAMHSIASLVQCASRDTCVIVCLRIYAYDRLPYSIAFITYVRIPFYTLSAHRDRFWRAASLLLLKFFFFSVNFVIWGLVFLIFKNIIFSIRIKHIFVP